MYLKAIEIQGFKSFANKITLEFNDGITGIVGPNGSGKSNIADAVRWVLGEQSAKTIRGSNMQDIIFAGTALKKPQGYAYVAIVLDNSDRKLKLDFDEVIVARRVYRSGESEYMINNSACRLKDINELFYDTGIGKEGYSIIGQGQIDKILSERPDERRELFDEAVGIVKFKKNKIAAIKKLEIERSSLDRVCDIITELETRVPTLEEESKKAKSYLKYRDELKKNEIDYFNLTHEKSINELDDLTKKLEIVIDNICANDKSLNQVKERYDSNQEAVDRLEKLIAKLSQDANDKEIEKNQYEAQIELIKEQINTLNEKSIECESRSTDEKNSLSEKNDIKNRLNDKKTESLSKLNEKRIEVSGLNDEFNSILSEINNLVEENNQYTDKIFEISGQINLAKASFEKNSEQADEIKSSIKMLNEKKDKYEEELKTTEERLASNSKELQNFQKIIDGLDKEISKKERDTDKLKNDEAIYLSKMRELEKLIDSTSSRISIYENMIHSYDGYSNAIKQIMSLRKSNNNIIGVVADIVKIDKKYETAMEIAFGSKLQNIIVSDENTAKSLIRYLKTNKYGRATFLPLNGVVDKTKKNADILNEDGVIGYASDIVNVDSSYKVIVSYLLGSLILVDEIDNATKLAKKYHQGLRIVTLQGELIAAGGSITGGDYKNNYNFLGRKNEIDSLTSLLKEKSVKLEEIKNKKDEISLNISKNNTDLSDLRKEIENRRLDNNSLEINNKQLKNLLNNVKNSIAEIKFDLKSRQTRSEQIVKQNSSSNEEIEDKNKLLEELNTKRAQMQERTDSLNSMRLTKGRDLEEKKIELAMLEQEMSFDEENLRRIDVEIACVEETIKRLERQSVGAKEEIKNKNNEIVKFQEIIAECKASHNELLAQIEERSKEKADSINGNKGLFIKLDELKNEHQLLSDEKNRLSIQKEKSETIIEQLLEYMWSEYELTAGEIKEQTLDAAISLSAVQKNIKELKSTLKSFGAVNLGAIEEYSDLSERLDFLVSQRVDIEKSEAALLELIKELDVGMCRQFKERFSAIAKQFDYVFKKLFGGGNAGLSLIDEENILESGININVQPPGKKLQSMLVLSGGEKALTAIALLFAIQSLKPSSFCLLDEIEAALDDSNVDRFASYLSKLTDKTQFIVITHRKGTMAMANRLYGITMQEKGVSTLVSVSLVEKELK